MVVKTTLEFSDSINNKDVSSYLVIGEEKYIKSSLNQSLKLFFNNEKIIVNEELLEPLNESSCDCLSQYFKKGSNVVEVKFAKIDSRRSRNLGIIRADSAQEVVNKNISKNKNSSILVILDNAEQARSIGSSISRVFPLYSKKTGEEILRKIYVKFIVNDASKVDYEAIQIISNATRYASKLGDTTAEELNPITIIEECNNIISKLKSYNKNVDITVIRGEDLLKQHFGGLWNVGKGSKYPPALIILKYTKPNNKKSIAYVGKGITFDSGGMCLKSRENMMGMKQDMDGAGSVLAAFEANALLDVNINVYGILCMAENAIGPNAERQDDIIQLKSGKTVEINNTDAEGRLVVSDGVYYASSSLKADYIVDIATLTGAQSHATGIYHGGVLTPSEQFERLIVDSGKVSGDLCYPLIYCPEYFSVERQYASVVADMRNSIKERNNAASSCAGHFIEEQLDPAWKKAQSQKSNGEGYMWAHLDVAYPAVDPKGRATGFGVPLFIELSRKLSME